MTENGMVSDVLGLPVWVLVAAGVVIFFGAVKLFFPQAAEPLPPRHDMELKALRQANSKFVDRTIMGLRNSTAL
jgi:hypothetical protein